MSFDNEAWRSETLKNLGIDPDKLNDEQKDIILQPLEAPENYAHDGELTPDEQFENWRYKLANCGLDLRDIHRAYKIITG